MKSPMITRSEAERELRKRLKEQGQEVSEKDFREMVDFIMFKAKEKHEEQG